MFIDDINSRRRSKMGYRADVSIAFYTTNTETLPLIAIKLWFDENFPKELPPEQVEVGDDYILARYEGYKWYPEYEEVRMVEAAVTLFGATFECDEDGAAHWETVRAGEELDDTEHEASPYATYRLNVSRTIHFD